jgi:hypothetical protein
VCGGQLCDKTLGFFSGASMDCTVTELTIQTILKTSPAAKATCSFTPVRSFSHQELSYCNLSVYRASTGPPLLFACHLLDCVTGLYRNPGAAALQLRSIPTGPTPSSRQDSAVTTPPAAS